MWLRWHFPTEPRLGALELEKKSSLDYVTNANDGDEDRGHVDGCGSKADAGGDDCVDCLEDHWEDGHADGVDHARARAHVVRPRADDDGRVAR